MWLPYHRRRPGDPAPVTPDDDDAALLAAVAGGRLDALRLLHRRHAPWLRARLARRCADPDAVDTALQDTFLAVWRDAGRYRARDRDAGAWLWTIAARKLVSALRGSGSRWVGQGYGLAGADGAVRSAEDAVLVGVEHGDLGAALAQLSPELRAAIQATVLDGLTVREASQLLGVPAGTVKTRVRRAKEHLRRSLGAQAGTQWERLA